MRLREIGKWRRAVRRLGGRAAAADAWLSASPNRVPPGASTMIAWRTGDGSVGQVWVSQDGKPEGLFAEGASGSQRVSWIGPRSRYQFRLYRGTARVTLLEAVTVEQAGRVGRRQPVSFGSLRRLTPASRVCGFDRGLPIDRYYIENFLARNCDDLRGRVLEIGDDVYTRSFGGSRVTSTDVLNLREGNPKTTIVADLTCADQIASDCFDCIIFTQTLQYIYDMRSAIRTLERILKPGGVLLATVPGISQISPDDYREYWCWRFTSFSARRLFEEGFAGADIAVEGYGNVLAAIAFLQGLAADELRREELEYRDPLYQVLISVRVAKPGVALAPQIPVEATQ